MSLFVEFCGWHFCVLSCARYKQWITLVVFGKCKMYCCWGNTSIQVLFSCVHVIREERSLWPYTYYMYLHAPVPSRKLMITVYSYGNQCMRKQCDSLIFPTAVECHILFVCWYPPGSASTAHMMSVQLLHHLASVWYLGCTCFVGSRLLASAHPPCW